MGTRWAILSDIHGNLEALEAVLADAAAQGAEKIAVLGDVIDYDRRTRCNTSCSTTTSTTA